MKKGSLSICTILGLFSLVIFSNVYAARPFATEDAGVAGNKHFQTELSVDYAGNNNGDKNYSFLFVPVYGICESVEFSAEIPYSIVKSEGIVPQKGLSDINLVLKTLIEPETAKSPAMLLKTVVKLSNGDEEKGLGSGDTDVGFSGVLSKDLKPFVVHANFGYSFSGKRKDPNLKNYILYGIAVEYYLNEKTKLVNEIYGESDSHFDIGAFKHHSINPMIGLTYQINEKAILDVSSRIGLTGWKKEESGLSLGLSLSY